MIELPKRVHEYVRQTTPELFPLRVYDLPCVDDRAYRLCASLPSGTELHVPVAHPHSELVSVLAAHASGFDAHRGADAGRVRRASSAARISLRGPGKNGEEIRAALAADAEVHADSPGELRLAGFEAERAGRDLDVVLRVAAAAGGHGAAVPESASGERNAAGMDAAALVECAGILASAAGSRLRLRGFGAAAPLPEERVGPRYQVDSDRPSAARRAADSARPAVLDSPADVDRNARALMAVLRPWSTMFGISGATYAIDADAPARRAWTAALLADSAAVGGARVGSRAGGGASAGPRTGGGADDGHGPLRSPIESAADAAASTVCSYAAALARAAGPHERIRLTSQAAVTGGAEWVLARVADIKHTGGRALALVDGGESLPRTAGPPAAPIPLAVAPTDRTWSLPWPRPELAAELVTVACRDGAGQRVLVHDAVVDHVRVDDVLAFPVRPGTPPGSTAHCVQG